MYHIRLKKARSFAANIPGLGPVSVTEKKPDMHIEDDEAAKKLISTGYFEIVSHDGEDNALGYEPDEPMTGGDPPPAYGGKTLEEMSVPELETFATYKNVVLGKGARKKNDIIKKLREELPPEETEGIITYGSPTMVGLQEEM